MKSMAGWMAVCCAVLLLCACGERRPPPLPSVQQMKKEAKIAATPISVADTAAESLEVVSSKPAGESGENFKVVGTLKAKKNIPFSQIFLRGDIVISKAGGKAVDRSLDIAVQGPWKEGETKEVAINISFYGIAGEREFVIRSVSTRNTRDGPMGPPPAGIK